MTMDKLAIGARRRLGRGEHARVDLRRHAAQGDVRHQRRAHQGAAVRRLGFRPRRAERRTGSRPAMPTACRWAATCRRQGKAPTFVVWAVKDPDDANLDRIQIVKGWTKSGQIFEKVYDVAWSATGSPRARISNALYAAATR